MRREKEMTTSPTDRTEDQKGRNDDTTAELSSHPPPPEHASSTRWGVVKEEQHKKKMRLEWRTGAQPREGKEPRWPWPWQREGLTGARWGDREVEWE
jgi:hypothetical protein